MKVQGVSFAKAQADLLYDPQKVTIAQMAAALSKYNYKVYALGGSK